MFYINLGLVFNKFTLEIFKLSSQPTIKNYSSPFKIENEGVGTLSGLMISVVIIFYFLSLHMIMEILNEKRIGLLGHTAAFVSLMVSFIILSNGEY